MASVRSSGSHRAACGALAAALALEAACALAQAWPARPVRLVVPFPAGGATDVIGRILAVELGRGLGQQVVVDNRAGASGAIATELVAKAPADGYTLILATASTQAINPAVSKVAFDPVKDFSAIGLVGLAPLGLAVHPSLPVRSARDLVSLARARPGELNMASFGTGSASHLAGELFQAMTRTKMVHVPYKGGAPAMTDLIAGQVSLYFDTLLNTIQPAKAGRVRLVAVTSATRSPAVPDVPTVAESGVPGYDAITWFALFGPAGLPREVVGRVNAEIVRIVKQSEARDKLAAQGTDPLSGTPESLAALLQRDAAKWAKLVRDANIRVE